LLALGRGACYPTGPRWGRAPSWPPSSFGPSRPPSTRTLGSALTTQRSRLQDRWPLHTVHVAASRQPASARAQSPPTGAPRGGLACLVGRPQPPAEAQPSPGPPADAPRRPPRDLRRGARIDASSGRPSRRGRGRTTWNSTRSGRDRCPAVPGVPHRHHRLTRPRRMRQGGRVDNRRLDAGRAWTPAGRTPAGRTVASGRGSQITGQWTGWTPDGLDTWTPTVDRRAGALAHCCPQTITGRA
jgi:hypothetical protein